MCLGTLKCYKYVKNGERVKEGACGRARSFSRHSAKWATKIEVAEKEGVSVNNVPPMRQSVYGAALHCEECQPAIIKVRAECLIVVVTSCS